jgi:hypothetical protein
VARETRLPLAILFRAFSARSDQTRATTLETRLAGYNERLSSLDEEQNEIDGLEEEIVRQLNP